MKLFDESAHASLARSGFARRQKTAFALPRWITGEALCFCALGLLLTALIPSAASAHELDFSASSEISLAHPIRRNAVLAVGFIPNGSDRKIDAVLHPGPRPAPSLSAIHESSRGGNGILSSPAQSTERSTPIYQAWYLYLALLFLGITLPAHLFRRRMLLMKGRIGIVLEERNRIARECHDTLMAGFAAISWQLEATSKLFRDSNLDSTPAAESCKLARSMVSHCQAEARRIIWDLRDTDEITSILSQALARCLAASHVGRAVETTLQVEGEEVQLAPGCVHHLVCIGQEAVTNAIRHASPSHISVHLEYHPDALCLCIRDDGRGFHAPDRATSRHGHFGIAVMKERAEKLGGAFRIQALAGSGTEVTVRVPFNALQQPVSQGQHVIRWIGI